MRHLRKSATHHDRARAPNLDRHGEGWESERDAVGTDGGWPPYLQRFVDLLAKES